MASDDHTKTLITVRLERDAYDLLMEHYRNTGYRQNLIVSDCITRTLKRSAKVARDEIGRPRPRPLAKPADRAKAAPPEPAA